jgi:hypothetical protein
MSSRQWRWYTDQGTHEQIHAGCKTEQGPVERPSSGRMLSSALACRPAASSMIVLRLIAAPRTRMEHWLASNGVIPGRSAHMRSATTSDSCHGTEACSEWSRRAWHMPRSIYRSAAEAFVLFLPKFLPS